jgi:uroporphyrinogen-III decarboxylase
MEGMSSRERIMASLRHEEVDRIPWCPLISGYYSLGLPEPLKGDDLAVQRAIGADIMERLQSLVYHPTFPLYIPALQPFVGDPVEQTTEIGRIKIKETRKGDQLLRMYETPVGDIQEIYERRESSPWMAFPVEYKIKELEDLKAYRYITEAQQFVAFYDRFIELNEEIGEDGIATTPGPYSPFQMLLEVELGVEKFYYFLEDYPDEMEELMEIMHSKNLEACEIISESPAEVVILYENTSTSYMSPPMFSRYIQSHLNEYADLYHKAGKIVLVHACGKLKDIAEEMGRGHYDGICDLAPPPTGDLNLPEAKELWGKRKVAMGGIDATTFISLKPEQMKEYVKKILRQVSSYRGVILGSGDAVPFGTPIESLKAITEVVAEYSLN